MSKPIDRIYCHLLSEDLPMLILSRLHRHRRLCKGGLAHFYNVCVCVYDIHDFWLDRLMILRLLYPTGTKRVNTIHYIQFIFIENILLSSTDWTLWPFMSSILFYSMLDPGFNVILLSYIPVFRLHYTLPPSQPA